MNQYHLWMAIAAGIALVASAKTPRGWLWIGMLAASFIVSLAYLRFYESWEEANRLATYFPFEDFPYLALDRNWLPPSIIAVICDALVCLGIHTWGREKWETSWLYKIVLVSVAVNLLYSMGVILRWPPIPDRNTLGIILEIINYAALALIGGRGIAAWVGVSHGRHRVGGALGRVLETGISPAPKNTFWKD